jgi:hypothetical protein
MPKHLTIEDVIARFAEQLRETIQREVENRAADLVKNSPVARKTRTDIGKPAAKKPCPVCGELNARRRYRNFGVPHTPAGVGDRKPKAIDVAATVTGGSADV